MARGIISRMITILLAVAFSGGVFASLYWGVDFGLGWSITSGLVSFGVFQVSFGLILRKKVSQSMERVQAILVDGQKRLQAKMARWQVRPPGSFQAAQKEIEADTRLFVKEALVRTEDLRRFKWWVPMIERQIATAQFQLNWMIKNFKKTDELMPQVIMLDPTMAAMKMARLQMLSSPIEEISKVYKKGVRRLRYNDNVLLAACYSWILVKRGLVDEAFKVLTEALKKSDNETLKRNHEHLMNNRVLQFTNSGLGDQWYSLFLEEPRVKAQRPRGNRFQ